MNETHDAAMRRPSRKQRGFTWDVLAVCILVAACWNTNRLFQLVLGLSVATVVLVALGRPDRPITRRVRRWVKWGWTTICALMLLGFASGGINLILEPLGLDPYHQPTPLWFDFSAPRAYQSDRPAGRWRDRPHQYYTTLSGRGPKEALGLECPLPLGSTQSWWVVLPLGWVFLLVAAPTAAFWWRDRPYPEGRCRTCGYDLTGNVTGVCPECGERI